MIVLTVFGRAYAHMSTVVFSRQLRHLNGHSSKPLARIWTKLGRNEAERPPRPF